MTPPRDKEITLSDLKGHWAIVTGASSGIGKEFAIQLARAGVNVVLVARRKELLEELKRSLETAHSAKTVVVALDLTETYAVENLKLHLVKENISPRLICNNAGMGRWGHFEKTSEKTYEEMIKLNATVMVQMCHRFLTDLQSFPTSAIINVSSAACYQPVPYMAAYAATKAFVQSFSQALYGEWKERGILVQTLVPGATETEFDAKAGAYESAITKRDQAHDVVRASLAGLESGNPVVVVAKGTFMQRFFAGLFPARMVIRKVSEMFKPN